MYFSRAVVEGLNAERWYRRDTDGVEIVRILALADILADCYVLGRHGTEIGFMGRDRGLL